MHLAKLLVAIAMKFTVEVKVFVKVIAKSRALWTESQDDYMLKAFCLICIHTLFDEAYFISYSFSLL